MITVILPTMFIPNDVEDKIKELCQHELIGEIIIIDNTDDGYELNYEHYKIKHIKEYQNIFVNPAWNKGYKLAKYDKLLFLNDDIYFDFKIIDLVYDHITEDKGIIGLGRTCYDYFGGEFKIQPINELKTGFGCLFFIHKKSYKEIPDDLKIWYGDDWLLYKSGKQPYEIMNWKVWGDFSQTTVKINVNHIIQNDEHNWRIKYNYL